MSTSPPHSRFHRPAIRHNHQINGHRNVPVDEDHHHQQDQVVILMVPLPAQGHLNQLLQLSQLIASSYPHIPIHFAASTTHNHQALLRSSAFNSTTATIQFHNLATPQFPSPPPNRNSPHKFPSHLLPSFLHANHHLRSPVSSLIRSLSSSKRLVVIYDSLMASAVREAHSLPNAESYTFHSVSAFTMSWFIRQPATNNKHEILLSFPQEFLDFVQSQYEYKKHSSGIILNTTRVLEGAYLDALRDESSLDHWAIGPFNSLLNMHHHNKNTVTNDQASHHCMEWLDEQEPNSVLYVSFGTTTAMSKDQVNELAIGLEKSGHKFVWVLREADTGDVFSRQREEKLRNKIELPSGYEERVRRVGLVIRDWAPQMRILGHVATGGFMSHCGWNSCMEGLSVGVPFAAWPMHSDQPKNAELVTEVLKAGVMVREWEGGEAVVRASEVEKAVRKLMGSEEGAQMRRRAAELGADVRTSVVDGGVSRAELGNFIKHISR